MNTNVTAPARRHPDQALLERFQNVSELLDFAADRGPDNRLLNFFEDGLKLTAGELQQLSLQLATLLREMGVGVGTAVGVMLPNQSIFPIAWMALLRLGAVMVPLNTRYTADEVRFVMGDSNAAFLLAHDDYAAAKDGAQNLVAEGRTLIWAGTDVCRLVVGRVEVQLPAVCSTDWPAVKPDDAAGIHYTSGTTGFPKGCVLPHRYWTVASATMKLVFPREPERILTDTPFFYIDALVELILALGSGAEQFVSKRPSLSKFTKWLAAFDIDYAEVWETFGEKTVDPDSEARLRKRAKPLIATTFGLQGQLHSALESRFNATIREQYGMTEIGLGTYQPYDDDGCVGSGSCGVAAPFRETRVVDPETSKDVPDGETGELWVRGPGVMLRYHNRFQVNDETFRPGGWFRTGDLVRRDERGHHYIVGRLKDMIRRSHENIAAAEVEAAMSTFAGVEKIAVVGVADHFRGEEVKAFVLLKNGQAPGSVVPQDLRAHALKHLAAFKVPRYYEFVTALPMTPSGKVSKGQLKADEEGGPFGWDAETNSWKAR